MRGCFPDCRGLVDLIIISSDTAWKLRQCRNNEFLYDSASRET
jgi:hypothetical protein